MIPKEPCPHGDDCTLASKDARLYIAYQLGADATEELGAAVSVLRNHDDDAEADLLEDALTRLVNVINDICAPIIEDGS